jgi:hypothetical protein
MNRLKFRHPGVTVLQRVGSPLQIKRFQRNRRLQIARTKFGTILIGGPGKWKGSRCLGLRMAMEVGQREQLALVEEENRRQLEITAQGEKLPSWSNMWSLKPASLLLFQDSTSATSSSKTFPEMPNEKKLSTSSCSRVFTAPNS